MKETTQIINLVNGNLSSKEEDELLNKLAQDAELRKEYERLKNAWALSSNKNQLSELNIERAYSTVRSKIHVPVKSILGKLIPVFRYAAIVVLVFLAGIYAENIQNLLMGNPMAMNDKTEILVPAGQVAEVNLPDGSHVWLNAGTNLSFSKNFAGKNRRVELEGEAFFEVTKGKGKFIVGTNMGDVTVLGTSFNVSAFNNSEFQTTLVEGSVKFKSLHSANEMILVPGQQLTISENRNSIIREVETNKYTSWKNGVIEFEKEPLSSVVKKLERHFAVSIVMENSQLGDIKFTGSIENETLPEVLNYISKTKPIQFVYDKNQKTLIIKPM